jgi:hypothetical protein
MWMRKEARQGRPEHDGDPCVSPKFYRLLIWQKIAIRKSQPLFRMHDPAHLSEQLRRFQLRCPAEGLQLIARQRIHVRLDHGALLLGLGTTRNSESKETCRSNQLSLSFDV